MDNAFPHPSGAQGSEGLSKREWFAGQALPSIMMLCGRDTRLGGETIEEYFVRRSYEMADLMIARQALENSNG